MMRVMTWLPALVLAAAGGAAWADATPSIITERPSFSSSPVALAPRAVQVEAGYQYSRNRGAEDSIDRTLPFGLLRLGLVDRVEVQLGWAGWSRRSDGATRTTGTNDPTINLKWQLTPTVAGLTVALLASTSVPLGAAELSSGEAEPAVSALWSYSGTLEWFGTVQVSHAGDETSVGNALGLSFALAPRTGAYLEYFGNYGRRAGPEHSVNGGLSYLLRPHLQLDVYAGAGLNERATDFFAGAGFGYRF
jgi:hypothetical protein